MQMSEKSKEVSDYEESVKHIANIGTNIETLKAKHMNATREIERLQKELHEKFTRIRQLEGVLTEKEDKLTKYNESIQKSDLLVEKLRKQAEDELAGTKKEVDTLKQKNYTLETQTKARTEEINKLNFKVKAAEDSVTRSKQEIKNLKSSKELLQTELNQLKSKNKEYESKLNLLVKENKSLKEGLKNSENIQKAAERHEKELNDLTKRLEDRNVQIGDLRRRLRAVENDMRKNIDNANRIERQQLRPELLRQQKILGMLKGRNTKEDKEKIENLSKEIDDMKRRINDDIKLTPAEVVVRYRKLAKQIMQSGENTEERKNYEQSLTKLRTDYQVVTDKFRDEKLKEILDLLKQKSLEKKQELNMQSALYPDVAKVARAIHYRMLKQYKGKGVMDEFQDVFKRINPTADGLHVQLRF